MDYHKCEICIQKYCGWSNNKTCPVCGSKLKEISEKEFYERDEEEVKSVSSKDI